MLINPEYHQVLRQTYPFIGSRDLKVDKQGRINLGADLGNLFVLRNPHAFNICPSLLEREVGDCDFDAVISELRNSELSKINSAPCYMKITDYGALEITDFVKENFQDYQRLKLDSKHRVCIPQYITELSFYSPDIRIEGRGDFIEVIFQQNL